jgi:2-keto-4-pentenoate hydratase/2-oxohepta-3-ene-1,7-dioic acid hydratase in catechol pathway
VKIARSMFGDSPQFFVSREGNVFRSLRQLGFSCTSLDELCQDLDAISAALARTEDNVEASDEDKVIDQNLLSPIAARGSLIGVGLNYQEHAEESNLAVRSNPLLFGKWAGSITGPYSPIILDPRFTSRLDYEVELGVVIGRPIERGQTKDLRSAVLGYVVANDVSARDIQFDEGSWSRAKSSDTYCPMGPYITTSDEVPDPHDLTLECRVNGELRQKASTSQMIFNVDEILEFTVQTMSLSVGDVILTGTPSGVAMGMPQPKWLNAGDVVRCEISGLGSIENKVQLDA